MVSMVLLRTVSRDVSLLAIEIYLTITNAKTSQISRYNAVDLSVSSALFELAPHILMTQLNARRKISKRTGDGNLCMGKSSEHHRIQCCCLSLLEMGLSCVPWLA